MSIHDDGRKRDKKDAGSKKHAIDPDKSEERSWLQKRTVQLIHEKYPDGNGFTSEFWTECYKRAKEEWDEQGL